MQTLYSIIFALWIAFVLTAFLLDYHTFGKITPAGIVSNIIVGPVFVITLIIVCFIKIVFHKDFWNAAVIKNPNFPSEDK